MSMQCIWNKNEFNAQAWFPPRFISLYLSKCSLKIQILGDGRTSPVGKVEGPVFGSLEPCKSRWSGVRLESQGQGGGHVDPGAYQAAEPVWPSSRPMNSPVSD